MLKTSTLFWAVKFNYSPSLKKICEWPNTYIEAPMLLKDNMNPFHLAALQGNEEVLSCLIDMGKMKTKAIMTNPDIQFRTRNVKIFIFNIEFNDVFPIRKRELYKYDLKFIKNIKKFAKWIFFFYKKMNFSQFNPNYQKDLYGNSPLHYACYFGFVQCAKILIIEHDDVEKPNNEGFTARDFVKNNQDIRNIIMEFGKTVLGYKYKEYIINQKRSKID